MVSSRWRVPGEPIELRLVVSQIKDQEGELLSEWLLWTNVPVAAHPRGVTGEQVAEWYYWRWKIGVSSEGSLTQSVQVRPKPRDSGFVAREAPGRESKPVKPSDNTLCKERAQRSRLQPTVNAAVAS